MTERLTDEQVQEIAARWEATTPRPWKITGHVVAGNDAEDFGSAAYGESAVSVVAVVGVGHDADRVAIAAAPSDVRSLLAEVAALLGERNEARNRAVDALGAAQQALSEARTLSEELDASQDEAYEWAVSLRRAQDLHRDALTENRMLRARLAEMAALRGERDTVRGVTWLLFRNGCVLLERCEKKARQLGVGEWFVPGGKLEPGETPEGALRREIAEEWPSVQLVTATPLPIVQGSLVGVGAPGLFLMQPFRVDVDGDPGESDAEDTPLRWVPLVEALASPVPQVRMMVAAVADTEGVRAGLAALQDLVDTTATWPAFRLEREIRERELYAEGDAMRAAECQDAGDAEGAQSYADAVRHQHVWAAFYRAALAAAPPEVDRG